MFQSTILEINPDFPSQVRRGINELLAKLDYQPVWQTIEWQLMLRESEYAAKSFFVGIYAQEKLLSYALLEKRSVGLGVYGFFAVGGPVVQEPASLGNLSETMRRLAKEEKVVFVELEPTKEVHLLGFTA